MDDKDFVEFGIEESKMPPKFLHPYYIFKEWFHLFRNKSVQYASIFDRLWQQPVFVANPQVAYAET